MLRGGGSNCGVSFHPTSRFRDNPSQSEESVRVTSQHGSQEETQSVSERRSPALARHPRPSCCPLASL
ncbi:hypothetical protein EYF80_010557 [Liparis tanakae]|uniref:Uncharacterized protein n=1 Tax=Liparis tanakae TaxID=230148 RepID=A0A4Z2IQ29_9TELE|nr:hypothetical protein EYF80_010557 [Liparis tanakae]